MILGIGTDITKVSRFEKWVKDNTMLDRFFNEKEQMNHGTMQAKCEHYAARFAAKEAFSKALGTGLIFNLKDVFITKDENGKPYLEVKDSAERILKEKCSDYKVHVSLSHEKEYATAFVIIEK